MAAARLRALLSPPPRRPPQSPALLPHRRPGHASRRPRPPRLWLLPRRLAACPGRGLAADLRFEPPLNVVQYPDPVLHARNKRIKTFDDNLRRLADEMFDVMYKTDGIGLSAPQVGVNVQLMVFNPAGVKGEGEEIVLINPVMYKFSKRLLVYEGCLSFPEIYANVLVRIVAILIVLLFDC